LATEKVCVNLSAAELGKLDVLVAEGVYVSRTDVVRAALRREFDVYERVIERHLDSEAVAARHLPDKVVRVFTGIGYSRIPADYLEERLARGERIETVCAGIVTFADDVTPELADKTVYSLRILGSVRGPKPVLDRIADRIHWRIR
jgi:Arc/MetJ-type ribon-helix-helix transcriptional regulator